jgi:phosphate/sulfate permease
MARLARFLDPYRRGRGFRRGLLPRVVHARSKQRRDYMARKYNSRRHQTESQEPQPAVGSQPEEARRRMLVRRAHFTTIVAAWVVTVPAAAVLSAVTFLLLDAAF